jgi:hypothetical protein
MNVTSYADVAALSKRHKRPKGTLIALAPANDPFALTPGRRDGAQWFADLWRRFEFPHGIHLRAIHYRLISAGEPVQTPDGKPYENTVECWQKLAVAAKDARYAQLVGVDWFTDQRNPQPLLYAPVAEDTEAGITADDPTLDVNLPDVALRPPELYLIEPDPAQRYLVEVWIEKSTMASVLEPVARRYGVNIVTGVGEMSLTACRDLIRRVKRTGKPTRILYISDFDPAGQSMPVGAARKIEFLARHEDDLPDIQLHPIALTADQCADFKLPRTPIKETERRRGAFEERFGEGATELDALEALHPGALREIVETEVERYYDATLKARHRRAADFAQQTLDEISREVAAGYSTQIEALQAEYDELAALFAEWRERAETVWQAIADDLEARRPDPDDLIWPDPAEGDEREVPLFDSRRDYVTQIDVYKEFQGKPTERRKRGAA